MRRKLVQNGTCDGHSILNKAISMSSKCVWTQSWQRKKARKIHTYVDVPRPSSVGFSVSWFNQFPTSASKTRDSPSRITNERGVASRRILQLKSEANASSVCLLFSEVMHGSSFAPFVQLDLERARVREHVVVRAHPCQDCVHGCQAGSC